jgi:hypothetical protein
MSAIAKADDEIPQFETVAKDLIFDVSGVG